MSIRPISDDELLSQMLLDIVVHTQTELNQREDLSIAPALPDCNLGMSNYDLSIDERLEDKLRSGYLGEHSAWNFNGKLWYADGMFFEEVWIRRVPQEVLAAPSLEELRNLVNEKYGSE